MTSHVEISRCCRAGVSRAGKSCGAVGPGGFNCLDPVFEGDKISQLGGLSFQRLVGIKLKLIILVEMYTQKTHMEPEKRQLEKGTHLQTTIFEGSMLVFRGVFYNKKQQPK